MGDDGDVGGCRRSLESLARFLFGEMRLCGGRDWKQISIQGAGRREPPLPYAEGADSESETRHEGDD